MGKKFKNSPDVTCICTNPISVNHILLECPITTELFRKDGNDFTACNNVRDILHTADVITFVTKLIVLSPVYKFV